MGIFTIFWLMHFFFFFIFSFILFYSLLFDLNFIILGFFYLIAGVDWTRKGLSLPLLTLVPFRMPYKFSLPAWSSRFGCLLSCFQQQEVSGPRSVAFDAIPPPLLRLRQLPPNPWNYIHHDGHQSLQSLIGYRANAPNRSCSEQGAWEFLWRTHLRARANRWHRCRGFDARIVHPRDKKSGLFLGKAVTYAILHVHDQTPRFGNVAVASAEDSLAPVYH